MCQTTMTKNLFLLKLRSIYLYSSLLYPKSRKKVEESKIERKNKLTRKKTSIDRIVIK